SLHQQGLLRRQPERSEGNPDNRSAAKGIPRSASGATREKRQRRDAGQPERSEGNPDNRSAAKGIPRSASGATREKRQRRDAGQAEGQAWTWQLSEIADRHFAGNAVDLMIGKLQRLAPQTQRILQVAACLGNRFEWQALAAASGHSQLEVHTHLAAAAHE